MELKKGYKQTDLGIIPEDWHVVQLDSIIRDFIVPMRDKPKKLSGEIPWCRIEDFDGKYLNKSKSNHAVDVEVIEAMNLKINPVNTLLVSCSADLGRCAIVKSPLITNQTFIGLVTNQKVSEEYLYYTMINNSIKLNMLSSGTTISYLSREQFEAFKVPLPHSLTEQFNIATALSDIDELISKTEKLIDKKKAIKQGAMQELLKPKDGWVTKKLKEIAIFRRGSFPQPYGLDKWYDDVTGEPFVQVFDVDDNKKLKSETKRYISKEAQKMSVFAKKGTIVLTIQGSIGRIAITQYDAYVDRTLLIFESYLVPFDPYFFMLTIHQLFEVEKQNAPGGIIKTITKEALSSFTIAYPNIKEQERIGLVMLDIENEIVTFETKLNKLKLQKQGMMQALLTGKIRLI